MGSSCSTITVVSGDSCGSLAARCGISAADFTTFNPSPTLCSSLAVGQKVCCSAGGLAVPVQNPDGSCASYTVVPGDTCAALAASNGITVADLNAWNVNTWGWETCNDLQLIKICLSTGTPPMPPPVTNAICGPQVPGTANPGAGANLSALNPCPLNACCDVWGQCGTTSDFCTPSSTGAPGTAALGTNGCISNCGTEITSGSPPAEFRRIAGRALNMDITQIDTTKYTHVHFAFLDITSTFDVDTSQFQDQFNKFVKLTGIKRIASFGGCTMSTDPDTYTIFRNAVSTSANQQTFASKLVAFVKQFGLDGLDIDWEYPGEQDIPGIPADSFGDGQNLAAFLVLLRSQLPSGLPWPTLWTTMTYDLHGQWDYGSAFDDPGCPTGGCLRSHVNLTETLNAFSMITKAGVPSNKLIVGVTSYGRSFQMTTAGCTGPLCTFTGPLSGATPGPCTNTAGYIANAEIDQIIANGGVQTFHDDESDSDILVYNSVQWVAYMDDDTKTSRTSTYKGLNMGGVSDWAVDLQAYLPAYTPPTPPPVRNPCTQVQGWVANWANYLLDNYYEVLSNDPGTGEQTECGCFPKIPEAWEEPVVFEAVTNWAWASGQIANGQSGNGAGALANSVFISEEISDSPAETGGDFGGGNDDVLWAALAWIKYYQYYQATVGKELTSILAGAKAFIDTVASTTQDQPCVGGVLWKPPNKNVTLNSKNTITNALFIHASTMYYSITGTTSYLTQAESVWNWMQTLGNQGSDGLYFDGVSACGFGSTLYTYNQGEMLAAAGALYAATGNKDYLTSGNATLNALVQSTDLEMGGILYETTCDADACVTPPQNADNAWSFKGIAMRGVQYFLDAANDPDITTLYSAWIGSQAVAITKNAQASNGDVGNVWYRPGAQTFNPASLGMAISAGNAAVKYGANDGTFTC
ncbi:hypothetical protein C8R45DRAFT_1224651 [Mycena sanguinolenta]|nr:hypothetical protein C8R45DRAFT_1224651 [Mycena sanguinolenta]